jgi:hypothetical protein
VEYANNIVAGSGDGNGTGVLRAVLEQAIAEEGCKLKDLTVLAAQNDPFRVDTPAGHRDGQWLAEQVEVKLADGRIIHLRGFHYALLGETKPDGSVYVNTEADWLWLQGSAAKAARWLGYIPFPRIRDARNNEPVVRIHEWPNPWPYISVGDVQVEVPDELTPTVEAEGFVGVQPFKLVLVGEKTSLEDVLKPIADAKKADLHLPSGEISDTLAYQMARIAHDDGRPMIVFYLSDCDPSGWQMPVSLARKLQALEALMFPGLEWEVRPICLTPDQVREYGLPYAPMKETERRADRWYTAMGVQQTEIDAIATLRPDLLREIVRGAIRPYFDTSLDRRVREARAEWQQQAQAILEDRLGPERMEEMRAEAELKLAGLDEQVAAINESLRVDVDDIDLPPIEVPHPQITRERSLPLVRSGPRAGWSHGEQCRRLIRRKAYEVRS